MDKAAFLPLSGFRDQLGSTKSWVIQQIQAVYEQYGYQALETPVIERREILLGKLGDEGQKQLYLFEDNGKRKVGLRYDLTVPLGRFVASNLGSLSRPFKRYEIGPSFRAEKPQKGRYRQFTQADIDIIGAPEPSSELELLAASALVCKRLGITPTIELNDRRVVTKLLEALGLRDSRQTALLVLLDKKEKLADEEFNRQFAKLGLSDVERRQVSAVFFARGDEAVERVSELLGNDEQLTSLTAILSWAKKRGLAAEYVPAMVRGLDYYTGTIFELTAPDYDGGTIAAGGRYDGLIEQMIGQKLPAVGISFGVDRLTDLLSDKTPADTLFVVNLPDTADELEIWVQDLRDRGQKVEVYLDPSVELGKQIKYADKRGYQTILIPFEREWSQGKIVRKNLTSGQQEIITRNRIGDG